jgi:pSer/pThr/pTyr-binding forkhead associated (FHA) protein
LTYLIKIITLNRKLVTFFQGVIMAAFIRLVLNSGPTPGKDFPLEKAEIFIGRDLGNDIVINDPEVSRRHARLYLQGNAYIIEDLGSTNGTSINGQHLTGPYMLRAGEQITFGERVNLSVEAVVKAPEPVMAKPSFQQAADIQPPVIQRQPVYQSPAAPPLQQSYQPPAQAQSYPPAQQVYPYQTGIPQQPAQFSAPGSYPTAQSTDAGAPLPFSGQVPNSAYLEEPTIQYRIPIWMFVVLGVLLITIVVLLIDDFHLWCPLFGIC